MSLGTNTLPAGYWLGSDTFRGTLKGTGTGGLGQALSETLRCELYNKNEGHVTKDRCQLVRTESPISGDLLISNGSVVQAVKDPLTGTTLKFKRGIATITTPVQRQQLPKTKKFYITRDVDITIQTLRNTTRVTPQTNEKIGTAGTPTGVRALMEG